MTPRALCLLLVLAPATAHAELIMADSLEWMAQDSDLIVRGRMTRVARLPGKVNGYTWFRVRMKVSETLRGAHRADLVFSVRDGYDPGRWTGQRGEVLTFLVRPGRHKDVPAGLKKLPTARRSRTYAGWPVIDLAKVPEDAALGRDGTVYKTRAALLAAIRAALKGKLVAGKVRSVVVDAAYSSQVYKALWSGSAVKLVLPLDSTTEALARGWLRSADVTRRMDAVKVLRHFRSKENIALLRGRLRDAGYWSTTTRGRQVRVYAVRKGAWEALQAWGVRVRRPVIEVPDR
jgi:hypothetical protein